MSYKLTPIQCRPWLLNGLSLKLIESHYENNYGGALGQLNEISAQLQATDFASAPRHLVNGLKRDQLIALNSTLLHELYFASLCFGEAQPEGALGEGLVRGFGSIDRWLDEFVAMAEGLAGGSGWVLLSYVPRDEQLINQYAADHGQAIAGAIPILAIDMYEHAYHMDFGANAKAYISAFMRNIGWKGAEARYDDARKALPPRQLIQEEFGDLPGMSVEDVRDLLASGRKVQLIDARPRHYAARTQDLIEGAVWRDPERIDDWIGDLSKSDPVVTFCVYGFHVGCRTAEALREQGFDAKYVKGGHVALKAAGGKAKLFNP